MTSPSAMSVLQFDKSLVSMLSTPTGLAMPLVKNRAKSRAVVMEHLVTMVKLYMVIMGIHEPSFLTKGQLLGGSCHLGYVVNNHGPWLITPLRIGLWDPFQMAFSSWLINGGES